MLNALPNITRLVAWDVERPEPEGCLAPGSNALPMKWCGQGPEEQGLASSHPLDYLKHHQDVSCVHAFCTSASSKHWAHVPLTTTVEQQTTPKPSGLEQQ